MAKSEIEKHGRQCARDKDNNDGCLFIGCRYGTEPYPGYMRDEATSFECLLRLLWRVTATYEVYKGG